MPTGNYPLLDPKVPLVFADGSKVYEKLAKTYNTHDQGYFILAPSGAGKTHFVEGQKVKHWLDGDDLWMMAKAHPDGEWWNDGLDVILEIEQKSDVITMEAKKLGFWVIGASNNWLKPDAIVIPDWETHKKWIGIRETTAYDGGATTDKLDQVISHRKWILEWTKQGVPKFETVEAAANALAAQASSLKP